MKSAEIFKIINNYKKSIDKLSTMWFNKDDPSKYWYSSNITIDEYKTTEKLIKYCLTKSTFQFIMETLHEDWLQYSIILRKNNISNYNKITPNCEQIIGYIVEYFSLFKIKQFQNIYKQTVEENKLDDKWKSFSSCVICPFSNIKVYGNDQPNSITCNLGISKRDLFNIFTKKKTFEEFYKHYKIIIMAIERGLDKT